MRILKYFLLIFLLVTIGLVVFVATQNPTYKITKSTIIKSPKTTVYNYLFDYRNWETFDARLTEHKLNISYTETTWGKGSYVAWNGDSSGYIQTVSFKENDSIFQKSVLNAENAQVTWKFKDTVGGTKITWITNGNLDFSSKVSAFFKGGIQRVLIADFEESMKQLDKTLNVEMNTFSIKEIGIVNRVGTYYLKQTFNSKEPAINKNIKIILPRLKKFCKENNIKTKGKPFILYTGSRTNKEVIQVAVCIPIRDSIFTSEGSNIQGGKLEGFTAMKTRLIGDYSHSKKAWKSAMKFVNKNKLTLNPAFKISEVYHTEIEDTRYPSKWQTDIYIPVFPKKSNNNTSSQQPVKDTLSVATPR
jgi:effector-binding domain-containing protein